MGAAVYLQPFFRMLTQKRKYKKQTVKPIIFMKIIFAVGIL